MSDWIDILRRECEKTSQRQVAKKIKINPTTVNLALHGKYPNEKGLKELQSAVEAEFLNKTVLCPVLGEIPLSKCQFHQKREFAATNPQRVMLYRACHGDCPNSKLEQSIKSNRLTVHQVNSSSVKDETQYPLDSQLAFLKRKAGGDEAKLCALLEKELTKLATRYNQLLWSKKYSRSEK